MGELSKRCLEYPETSGAISGIIDWFKGEIQRLSGTFAEANKNITCFAVAGILKMLEETGSQVIQFLDVCSFCFLLSRQIKCESGSLFRAARRALSVDCVGVVVLCPGSVALSRA
jgi:hypothetical protein